MSRAEVAKTAAAASSMGARPRNPSLARRTGVVVKLEKATIASSCHSFPRSAGKTLNRA